MAEEKKGCWCDIFKTFKYAISPQKILVALVGLIFFNVLCLAVFQQPVTGQKDRFRAGSFWPTRAAIYPMHSRSPWAPAAPSRA